MTIDPFKHFAAPCKRVGVDVGPNRRFEYLTEPCPALRVFPWDDTRSDTENFEALVQFAVDRDRN